jgi:multiple sugar transport system ATP-binding protein
MDEPLSNLDAALRAQMRAELIRLHTRLKATIVYVTHDQAEAMTMATRVAVMSKGHLAQVGAPQQIYDHPSNLFVASFIGLPRMNILTGRLTDEDGAPAVEMLGLRFRLNSARLRQPDPTGRGEVLVGIRPEDVLCYPSAPGTARINGCVEVVEPLGSESLVTARCNDATTLVARVPPRSPIAIGDKVPLAFNSEHLHLFDPVTQHALLNPIAGPLTTNLRSTAAAN